MAKRSKLKDIAEALGVSITTVSRALNNKTDINQRTKRRILEMANELDYKPNNVSISLRKNKDVNVIGVVIPMVNHYFFSTVLKGIMTKAHLHNYLVIVGESLHKVQKEKQILANFIDYGVNGILLAPCIKSNFEKNLLPIIHRRIPAVVMDRTYENYDGNYVLTDDFQGAFIAVKHLIGQGYKRIAHIGSRDVASVGYERKRGYLQATKRLNYSNKNDLIELIRMEDDGRVFKSSYMAAKILLTKENPPDAIFTVTDDVAIGVINYAHDVGLRIPEDLGVVGFSNSLQSRFMRPSITTVEQNGVAMGSLSFEFFHQALYSNGHVFQKVFEPKLLVRESSSKDGNLKE